ncbi:MAG: DUF502 domain-containing protein [Saprospiraceae bacterium]|nr:DUF502 domain-containing protein [Saprospiraceae bacterium]
MKRLQKFVVTTLIGGGVILLPIVILVFVVKLIIQFIDGAISPLTQLVEWEIPGLLIDVIALIAIILFCFLVGLFIRTQMGLSMFRYIEKEWLEKIPAYSTIRDIVQQFTGAKKAPFKKVVMVDPFNTGTKMTGFVTDEQDDYCTIFVPTAPNPTNGFIFHVHKDNLEWLDIKTEAAMRTVVGMGVGSQDMIHQSAVDEEPDARETLEIEHKTDR